MEAADEPSLVALYSDLPDGKLLEIATKEEDLTDAARRVLRSELARRGITDGQIAGFARNLRELELADRAVPIASRVNGCGTVIVGHEDERPDGSYVVTKVFTLFWIPVFRMGKMRIKPVTLANGHGGYVMLEKEGGSHEERDQKYDHARQNVEDGFTRRVHRFWKAEDGGN